MDTYGEILKDFDKLSERKQKIVLALAKKYENRKVQKCIKDNETSRKGDSYGHLRKQA